jgi:hypothetical protein
VRRIGPFTPKLFLNLIRKRAEAEHVGHVDHNAHAIAQSGAFRLCDQLHVQKRLTNARLIALHQRIGARVDAAHPGNKNKIAGARANIPGAGRLYRAGRAERLHAGR